MGKYTSFLGKKLPVAALVMVLLGCGNAADAAKAGKSDKNSPAFFNERSFWYIHRCN